MKKIKLILLCLSILTLASCSKDDNGNTEFIDITGTWQMTEGSIEETTINLNIPDVPFPVPVKFSGRFIDISDENRLFLNEDHSFSSISGGMAVEISVTFLGEGMTERFDADNFFSEGTWERNNNELIIRNSNGTTIPYHIDQLTQSNLELSTNVKDLPIPDLPIPSSDLDIEVRMKLKRL